MYVNIIYFIDNCAGTTIISIVIIIVIDRLYSIYIIVTKGISYG